MNNLYILRTFKSPYTINRGNKVYFTEISTAQNHTLAYDFEWVQAQPACHFMKCFIDFVRRTSIIKRASSRYSGFTM